MKSDPTRLHGNTWGACQENCRLSMQKRPLMRAKFHAVNRTASIKPFFQDQQGTPDRWRITFRLHKIILTRISMCSLYLYIFTDFFFIFKEFRLCLFSRTLVSLDILLFKYAIVPYLWSGGSLGFQFLFKFFDSGLIMKNTHTLNSATALVHTLRYNPFTGTSMENSYQIAQRSYHKQGT